MEKNIQKEVKAKQKAKTKIHTEVKAKKETKTKAKANAVDLSHKTQSTKEVVNPDKKIEEAIAHLKNQLAAKSQRTEAQPGIETYGYVGTKEGEKILNAKMQNYYRYISQKIKSSWAFPELVLASEDKNPLAILTVEIRRDGSVKDIQFEKKSGSEVFDNSVEKAVKKASPFPPLPYEYRGSTIEIGIRFTKDKF